MAAMTKSKLRAILSDLAPVTVKDGGMFESVVLAAPDEGGAQIILFQGERRVGEAIAYLITEAATRRS